jgi:enediyne biosynthesis protein E4
MSKQRRQRVAYSLLIAHSATPPIASHLWLLLFALLLTGCYAAAAPLAPVELTPVTVAEEIFTPPTGPCPDHFVAHDLPHVTRAATTPARLFDSNGSGLAIGDLNRNGRLDIALGNLAGPSTLLWNQGDLNFQSETLPLLRRVRALALVDVDGDGWLDITATNGTGAPIWLRNLADEDGGRRFVLSPLDGVRFPANVMAWGDWNGDGLLDLVTASYDAGLMQEAGNRFLFGGGGGVVAYTNTGDGFHAERLIDQAQALAVALYDLDGDGRPDILVGNDFEEPDRIWLQRDDGWQPDTPFPLTSHSTMGFDRADVDNTGQWYIYSTDMKPYRRDIETLAAWMPLTRQVYRTGYREETQWSENMLQVPTAPGRYRNEGYTRHIDATGWSWSAKFGDLDHDGHLDLYVVNGMIAADLLDYLPGYELVEENQALRNDGRGFFEPAPGWTLGSTRSGRSMSMADLNGNGQLDIVVNNLESPAQLFENRLCGGDSLVVAMAWPGSGNVFALGAEVRLVTDHGVLRRDVRAGSGYLSGDPPQLHFGFPSHAALFKLEILWPDGQISEVPSPHAGRRLTISR